MKIYSIYDAHELIIPDREKSQNIRTLYFIYLRK